MPSSKAIRRDYHGTEDGRRLQQAKKSWKRTASKGGVSFAKFCKRKNIPTSTLRNEVNGKSASHKRGARHNCDELLQCSDNSTSGVTPGKIFGGDISFIIAYWKEKEIHHREKGHYKRKKQFFVGPNFFPELEKGGLSSSKLGGWPSAKDTAFYTEGKVHVMVNVSNRHWIYILVDMFQREMKAFNSRSYYSNRRQHAQVEEEAQKVEHKYMLQIKAFICSLEVEANINKKMGRKTDLKSEKWNITVAKGLPSQSNDLDCGVFATFYADCMRNQFTIKDELTEDEIQSYRRKMHKYILKGVKCNQTKPSKRKAKGAISLVD